MLFYVRLKNDVQFYETGRTDNLGQTNGQYKVGKNVLQFNWHLILAKLKSANERPILFNSTVHFDWVLPTNSKIEIVIQPFETAILQARIADLNIFSIRKGTSIAEIASIAEKSRISVLFCSDSGYENAFV